MSLFSGTKAEIVQDGEFVRHVHVNVFRNKNGNGPLLKVNARLWRVSSCWTRSWVLGWHELKPSRPGWL